jgi:hypothetical protein
MNYAAASTKAGHVGYHGPNSFGWFAIEIDDSGNVKYVSTDIGHFDFYVFHGWTAWAAWGLLGFIQVFSNRYMKVYWKASMWVHRICGFLILAITVMTCVWAIRETGWYIKD